MKNNTYRLLDAEETDRRLQMAAASEAPPSESFFSAKQLEKIRRGERGRAAYPQATGFFGDKDRLYLEMTDTTDDTADQATRRDIADWLHRFGYTVTDYAGGYATDKDGKQKFLIGKILAEHALHISAEAQILGEKFKKDRTRTDARLIVISRDALDIARMSTGRNWTSCLDVAKIECENDIEHLIARGVLVAYLLAAKDMNVEKPLGRVLVKPYWQTRFGSTYADDSDRFTPWHRRENRRSLSQFFAKAVARVAHGDKPRDVVYFPDKIYGQGPDAFRETVAHFFNDTVNKNKTGLFKCAPMMLPEDLPDQVRLHAGTEFPPVRQLKFLMV